MQSKLDGETPSVYLLDTLKKLNQWGKIKVNKFGIDFGDAQYSGITEFLDSRGFFIQNKGYWESDPVVSPGSQGRCHSTQWTYGIFYRSIALADYVESGSTSSPAKKQFLRFSDAFRVRDALSNNAAELLVLSLAKGLGADNLGRWLDRGILSLRESESVAGRENDLIEKCSNNEDPHADWSRDDLVAECVSCWEAKNYDEALIYIRKARYRYGADGVVLNMEGVCLHELGYCENALSCLDQALEIDPTKKEGLKKLSELSNYHKRNS